MLLATVASLLAVAPAAATAATPDPDHVTFGLEGCRLVAGETLPNADGAFVCADSDYTHGNLGKNWNELDLVPHRLTANAGPAQTYAVAIAADNRNFGPPPGYAGYDAISVPVVNTALSTGTCSVTAGAQSLLTPGQGGAETSIYRILTVTQGAGSHCVFDYYERLAIGSHLYPGSSLHSNLLNQDLTTSGIGSKEVPLPVNQISAQGLRKTMSATTGKSSVWNVTKDASPLHLDFDTCTTGAAASAQPVTITVNWTKTATSADSVTIVTNITLDNPASRAVTATVEDKIYSGTDQSTQVGTTFTSAPTVVPANSSHTITDTQTIPVSAATHYNDVATATYSEDPALGLPPIAGGTTAAAGADLVTINTPNDSATITDTEQITGTGLSFSIDSVSLAGGTFAPSYTPGSAAQITGPIAWTSPAVTDSGSAVFHKTVHVAGPLNTTGTLSDTATVADQVGTTPQPSASAATSIAARACIQGQKFNDLDGNGVRDAGEPGLAGVTIYVDLNGNGAPDAIEPSAVTDANGNYSISTATIPDGIYALREILPTGQVCTFPAGDCSHTITVGPGGPVLGQDFGNHTPPPPPIIQPVVSPVSATGNTTTPPVKKPVVKGVVRVSGASALHGPTHCITKAFVAGVTGRSIAKVQFYLDNRLVATRTKRDASGRYSYRIDPAKLNFAAHRLAAKVTYTKASRTKARTLKFGFTRCARGAVIPFTG